MNLLDILSISSHLFLGNEWGQQMRIQIWILRFKELNPLLRLPSEAIIHEPNQIRI